MSEPVFRYNRSDFAPLAVTLRHLDIQIDFHPAHIDGIIVLHVTAREPMSVMHLDARHLDLSEVAILDDAGDSYAALVASHEQALTDSAQPCEHTIDGDRLHITLPRTVAAGDTLRVAARAASPRMRCLKAFIRTPHRPAHPNSTCRNASNGASSASCRSMTIVRPNAPWSPRSAVTLAIRT